MIRIILSGLVFLISMTAAAQTQYARPTLDSLAGAELVLFTNPEMCGACARLEQQMKAAKQSDKIQVQHAGQTVRLSVRRVDPWNESLDPNSLLAQGYRNVGIPQFAVVRDGRVLGTGYPSGFSIDGLTAAEKKSLLPRPNESVSNYSTRLEKVLGQRSSFNLSEPVLEAVGLLSQSTQPNPEFKPLLGETNVLIAGTAMLPLDNPIFTAVTIKKAISALQAMAAPKPVVLYGGASEGCDTCQVKPKFAGKPEPEDMTDDEYYARREIVQIKDLPAVASTTRANVMSFFDSAKANQAKRNLIVLVGHGSDDGMITWFESQTMRPETLRKGHLRSGSQNILVSGNCFGGIMARSVSCGFMAAPPDLPASGCWDDAESGKSTADYISLFFNSAASKRADFDKDGDVSFLEAHSYATINANEMDVPYTTEDDLASAALIDYSGRDLVNPVQLLKSNVLTPSERVVAAALLKKTNVASSVSVREEATELSGVNRQLRILQKRATYRELIARDPSKKAAHDRLMQCQNTSIRGFLAKSRADVKMPGDK